jgi:Tol biopolymer transport system component
MKTKNILNALLLLAALLAVSCKGKTKAGAAVTNPFADSTAAEALVTRIPNITAGAEAYFSPDGESLIYNGKEADDSSYHVYTIRIDGSNRKRINNLGDDACSFFHPDGKEIVWTSTRDNLDLPKGNWSLVEDYPQGAELYLSDLDGGNIRRLTDNKYYDAEVGFSPDGKHLLFARQIDGAIDLWLADADGSNQRQITFTPDLQEGGSQFLPDGKTILFRAWKKSEQDLENKDMHIYTVNSDGTGLRQITTESGTHWAPYPAPDGIHAVYVKVLPPHNYEIFLLNLQTGEEKRLTYNSAFDGFPSVSPDGKYIAFSSSRSAGEKRNLKLYLLDAHSLNIGSVQP